MFYFWGPFGIYYRAYKSNPIVIKIQKLTEGFKLHNCFKSLLKSFSSRFLLWTWNVTPTRMRHQFITKCLCVMVKCKKEELNVYFSLDFHPVPWVIYPEILIISPNASTANMKTGRKIYLLELFSSAFSKVKRWLWSNYLMKRIQCVSNHPNKENMAIYSIV